MSYHSYEDYQRLQCAFTEKYHFNQESLRLILIGPFESAGFFRKSSDWSNELRQEQLKRIEEYLENPFTLLDDIHYYLHNEKNGFLPYLESALFHENPKEPGELIPDICFDEEEDTEAKKKWKKNLKNDIRRVYHWFQPKFDEKNGGLLPSPPYQRVLNDAIFMYQQKSKEYLNKMNELSSLLEQAKDTTQALPLIQEGLLIDNKACELTNKLINYARYAISPDIVRIVWQHRDIFAPVFSQKLTSLYHWKQASSIHPTVAKTGQEYVDRMNGIFEKMNQLMRDREGHSIELPMLPTF